jgi:hypothetical protein
MRWAGHIARMEKKRNTILWLENLKRRDRSEDIGIDKKIILGWNSGKESGK